jgi:aldose 1-epimerase
MSPPTRTTFRPAPCRQSRKRRSISASLARWANGGTPLPLAPGRGGYNHSWLLDKGDDEMAKAAILSDPLSGRRLTVETTEPSLHIYTGDYFDGEDIAPSGARIRPRDGIALETQHLADSPNRPEFPSTVLRPGETYRATTIWRFDVER